MSAPKMLSFRTDKYFEIFEFSRLKSRFQLQIIARFAINHFLIHVQLMDKYSKFAPVCHTHQKTWGAGPLLTLLAKALHFYLCTSLSRTLIENYSKCRIWIFQFSTFSKLFDHKLQVFKKWTTFCICIEN